MINVFVNKDISSGDAEIDVYQWGEEPEFEESIAERTKMRRQKSDKENQEGKGLKILTSEQMLSTQLL